MMRRVWILAFIDDPFDPLGEGRFGGGQSFIFDLGRALVRHGFDVTYITQLNAPSKPKFERLGPRCRIHRLEVGEARYRMGEEAGLSIDELAKQSIELFGDDQSIVAFHAQYWVSAAVALQVRSGRHIPLFLYPMSFGRAKIAAGEAAGPFAGLRESIEPWVLEQCDHIVVGTPEERDLLRTNYAGLRDDQVLLAPLWSDSTIFSPRPELPDRYIRRTARRFSEGV